MYDNFKSYQHVKFFNFCWKTHVNFKKMVENKLIKYIIYVR